MVCHNTTLGAVTEFINGGAWSQEEYASHGIPVVRVTDIRGETVEWSEPKFLPFSSLGRYAKHVLREGDLVICTVGSHPSQPGSVVGRPGIIPRRAHGALLNQNAVCIRSSCDQLDQEWLGHLARTGAFRDYIIGCARGSANQVRMALGLLKGMPVCLPPIEEQRRIALILSAYDDLIENCQRRIRILEEMARNLYREWFVHFRYPGHESVPLVPSPLGPIPQGWKVKTVGDISSLVNRGISPSYDDDGPSLVINQKCIREQRVNLDPARKQCKPIPTDKLVRFGDVLINSTGVGTLGRVAQLYEHVESCTVDSHVTIVRPKPDVGVDFFGCTLLTNQDSLERLGVGATGQTELGRSSIAGLEIIVAPPGITGEFGRNVRPLRTQAHLLGQKAVNLRRTRDLLLPKLL